MKDYERDKFLLDAHTCRLVQEFVPQGKTLRELADFFSAMADCTRLKILSALSITPMCVSDVSQLLGINQTTVSHQLKNLRLIGAVERRKQGRITFYSIRDRSLLDVMLSAVNCLDKNA